MRITFVLNHAYMSGGDKVIATYARELMSRGHVVNVVSRPWPPLSLKDRVRRVIHPRRFRRPVGVVASPFDGTGVPHHAVRGATRPIVDSDVPDADVVVATWWETAEWVAALSPAKGAKAYLIQHYETWGGAADRVDATWRLPLHKVVISKWLADLAREKFGDADVSHVPNSVDRGQFDAPPRGRRAVPTVGMLYSSMPFKGCDVSFAAVERAAKSIPNLKLSAFGIGPVVPEMPLPAGAAYTQNPPQDRIKDLYAACDVWLCGSRGEGFHLPPLEAMACRCPVVSTKVGGPLDTVVDGVNGYLADVEDSAGLADRLVKVLSLSDERWREMSDAAYATACRYTWQDACDLLEAAFAKSIAAASERRQVSPAA